MPKGDPIEVGGFDELLGRLDTLHAMAHSSSNRPYVSSTAKQILDSLEKSPLNIEAISKRQYKRMLGALKQLAEAQ